MRGPSLTLVVCTSLATSVPWAAAAQTPTTLTLADAVTQAVERYPAVQAATSQRDEAQAGVALSRTTYRPRADLLWQANRATRNNISGLLLPQSVISSITGPVNAGTGDSTWNNAAGALLSWEPFDFGARSAAVEAAEAGARAADAGIETVRLGVATTAADAYLAAVSAEQELHASEAAVDRARTVFEVVDARARAGLRPGADAARARAEVAAAETAAATRERDAAIARAELARWLDVDPKDLRLPDSIAAVPGAGAGGATAAADTPAVQQQAARVAAAEKAESAAAHAYAPRVFLEAAVSTRESGAGPDGSFAAGLQSAHNWAAGVNVVFPLLDRPVQGARRAAEHARAQEAAARYEQTLDEVRTDRAKAQAVLDAARRVAELAVPQLEAARTAEAQTRARYDSGLGTIADVADTQRLLTDAEVRNAVASIDVWRATIGVAAAGGTISAVLDAARAAGGR